MVNLLAFFMHQIFELVDGMYQRVRTFFSSRRAFWDEARSAFRLFLFTSWDQVLERMNSPPEHCRLLGLGSSTPSLHLRLGRPRAATAYLAQSPLCACRVGWRSNAPTSVLASGDGLSVWPSRDPLMRQFASFHAAKGSPRIAVCSLSRPCGPQHSLP